MQPRQKFEMTDPSVQGAEAARPATMSGIGAQLQLDQ
jgi:hypothetical protein